jgi:2-polyprenyl-3-methyl-5-hydroxy-6-metoxy-1,4-benzoquinol methylase
LKTDEHRIDLSIRRRQPELMDQPGVDPAEHRLALRGLQRVNALSRTAAHFWREIQRAFPAAESRQVRILDVACGGGDVAIALQHKAALNGRTVEVAGCDISPVALDRARQAAADAGVEVRFEQRDVIREGLPTGFDVICCSLFLHHLDDSDALRFLELARASSRLVLVSDLIRSRLGYWLAWSGTRLCSRSPIVHFDGPVSIEGAFTVDEVRAMAAKAGMEHAGITHTWPQRFLLTWRADGPANQ